MSEPFCINCAHYEGTPFEGWCHLHDGGTAAYDGCGQFLEKDDE